MQVIITIVPPGTQFSWHLLSLEKFELTQRELEETQFQLKQERTLKDTIITELRSEISKLTSIHEASNFQFTKNIEEHKSRTDLVTAENVTKDSEITTLKQTLEGTRTMLKEKEEQLQTISSEYLTVKTNLEKEVGRLKQDYSAKILDMETVTDTLKEKEQKCEMLQSDYNILKASKESDDVGVTKLKEEFNSQKEVIFKQFEETKSTLISQLQQVTEQKDKFQAEIKHKDEKISEMSESIQKYEKQLELLNLSINELREEHTKTFETTNEIHKRDVQDHRNKIVMLASEVKSSNENLQEHQSMLSKLKEQLLEKSSSIESFRLQLDSEKRQVENEQQVQTKLVAENNGLKLQVFELQRALEVSNTKIAEFVENNNKLQIEIQSLISAKDDSAKFEQYSKELQEKNSQLEAIKHEYTNKLSEEKKKYEAITIQLNNIALEIQRSQHGYEEKIKLLTQAESATREKYEGLKLEHSSMKEMLTKKLNMLTETLQQKEKDIQLTLGSMSESQHIVTLELQKAKVQLESTTRQYQESLEAVNKELTITKETLSHKMVEFANLESKLKDLETQLVEKEIWFSDRHSRDLGDRENQLQQQLATIQDLQGKVHILTDSHSNCGPILEIKHEEINQLTQKLTLLSATVQKLQTENEQLVLMKEQALLDISNMNQQHLQRSEEMSRKQEELIIMETKYQQQLSTLKEQEISTKITLEENVKTLTAQLQLQAEEIQSLRQNINVYKENCDKGNLDVATKHIELQQLQQQIAEKESMIIKITDEKQLLHKSHEELTSKFTCSSNELNAMFQQLAEITQKANAAEKCNIALQVQHNNYQELFTKLQITNKQKAELLRVLSEIKDSDKCRSLLELSGSLNVISTDEQDIRIAELRTESENLKVLLVEKDRLLASQQAEVLTIQKQLLQVILTIKNI